MQSEKRSSSIAEDRVAGLPAGWASSLQRLTRRGRTTSVLRNDHTGLSCLELSFLFMKLNFTFFQGCRFGSAFSFPPRSGSWREKLKNNDRKNARKLVLIIIFIKIYVNLDHLHGFFSSSFEQTFFLTTGSPLQGNFLPIFFSWIRIRIEKAYGSGSAKD